MQRAYFSPMQSPQLWFRISDRPQVQVSVSFPHHDLDPKIYP